MKEIYLEAWKEKKMTTTKHVNCWGDIFFQDTKRWKNFDPWYLHENVILVDEDEGLCAKRAYIEFLANFHFLQDWANFWQTEMFWHEKHRSVMVSVDLRFILQK